MSRSKEKNALSMTILDVVPLCGPEAARWLNEFLGPDNEALALDCFAALRHFRKHDHAAGRQLLQSVREQLEARNGASPAIGHILNRWYFGARAYSRYLLDDLDGAEADMMTAQEEIGRALSCRPFLMPLINHCVDFRIQRARIARQRHQWRDVRKHIGALREMFGDRRPFIVLADGQAIHMRDFRAYYERLPLTPEKRDDLKSVLDESYPHDRELDRLEESIFAIPDFVIPYP